MRTLLFGLTCLGCVFLASSPVLAAAKEFSRDHTTVTVGLNTITADNSVKYVGYVTGEWIPVTLEYSATCNIVFNDLTRSKLFEEITNVSGTPTAGSAANTGSVTFALKFNRLGQAPTGTQFGLARLSLVLGVDKDCNLATGDVDGVDGPITLRVLISVSSDSQPCCDN